MAEPPKTMDVKQVAEGLQVRPERVRQFIKSKELKAVNIGSKARPRYRIRISDYEAFIDARSVTGIEED